LFVGGRFSWERLGQVANGEGVMVHVAESLVFDHRIEFVVMLLDLGHDAFGRAWDFRLGLGRFMTVLFAFMRAGSVLSVKAVRRARYRAAIDKQLLHCVDAAARSSHQFKG
jgi:hypothetical protein